MKENEKKVKTTSSKKNVVQNKNVTTKKTTTRKPSSSKSTSKQKVKNVQNNQKIVKEKEEKKINKTKKQEPKESKKEIKESVLKEDEKKVLEKIELEVPVEVPVEEEKKEENVPKSFILQDKKSFVSIILAASLVILASIIMFIDMRKDTYSKAWDGKSYLVSKNMASQISCNELQNILNKKQAFVYIQSFDEDYEQEFNLEKELNNIIEDYELKDDFYVYQLNDNCGGLNDVTSVASKNLRLPYGISKVPTILYYKNGSFVSKITREDNQMMNASDFVQMLDIYEFKR